MTGRESSDPRGVTFIGYGAACAGRSVVEIPVNSYVGQQVSGWLDGAPLRSLVGADVVSSWVEDALPAPQSAACVECGDLFFVVRDGSGHEFCAACLTQAMEGR